MGRRQRTSGGAYASSADDAWDFAQFGTLAISCNGTDTPQKITIDSGSNFRRWAARADHGPRFVEVMGDFVVFARLLANRLKTQWSGDQQRRGLCRVGHDAERQPDDPPGRRHHRPDRLRVRRPGVPGAQHPAHGLRRVAGHLQLQEDRQRHRRDDPRQHRRLLRPGVLLLPSLRLLHGGRRAAVVPIGAEKVDQTFWGSNAPTRSTPST